LYNNFKIQARVLAMVAIYTYQQGSFHAIPPSNNQGDTYFKGNSFKAMWIF
jgi:hypothetical protein